MTNRHNIYWTRIAAIDLEEIIRYISINNPKTAKIILSKIRKSVTPLYDHPLCGRVVPELEYEGIHLYRELILNPWRIIYRVSKDSIYILAVIDSRKNIEDILLNRLMRDAKESV